MDIMSQLSVVLGACLGVFLTILISIALSQLIQWLWAWTDDGKPNKNYVISKLTSKSKWKYPVYNSRKPSGEPFGYAKDEKFNNACCWNLTEDVDYIYNWRSGNSFVPVTAALSLAPLAVFIAFKLYILTAVILLVVGILYLTRYARRTMKSLAKHKEDPNAHKEK